LGDSKPLLSENESLKFNSLKRSTRKASQSSLDEPSKNGLLGSNRWASYMAHWARYNLLGELDNSLGE